MVRRDKKGVAAKQLVQEEKIRSQEEKEGSKIFNIPMQGLFYA